MLKKFLSRFWSQTENRHEEAAAPVEAVPEQSPAFQAKPLKKREQKAIRKRKAVEEPPAAKLQL